MDKFKEIRPIVIGLATKDGKILVGEHYDSVRNLKFYRCLGGGIEFLEKSEDALKREFLEETNTNIIVKDFLGLAENIFICNGKNAHEIVLMYKIEIPEEQYKEEYNIKETKCSYTAKWVDINDFKNGNKTLFPKEIFKYL